MAEVSTGMLSGGIPYLAGVSGDDWEDWIYSRFADGTLDITPRTPEGAVRGPVRFFVDGSA